MAGTILGQLTIRSIANEVDEIHRKLARLSVNQLQGASTGMSTGDILSSHPAVFKTKTISFLRKALEGASDEEAFRIERLLYACMDLAIEERTASLGDMLKFYVEHGRMVIGPTKIPALEVVPWLQAQPDFDKREEMRKENTIFLKVIINPMLLGTLELSVRTVTERFGFANYASFSQGKKRVSFEEQAAALRQFLANTTAAYRQRMTPWVEEKIGRPFENLSRYHALYLLRISSFDHHFPVSRLREIVGRSFENLGFDPWTRPDVVVDISEHPSKNPNGMCVGVEIPGEVYVLMKPVGGFIDVETLLHETGHAFFLSSFDPSLPMEFRRLYSSTALDETFAFLFMDLVENPAWLAGVAGLPAADADSIASLFGTRRLCLIRRYIGKFLAEKELHETGNLKNSEPYCRHLNEATGFVYEPEGYLVDMEPDFYALDYLTAWGGAHVLRQFLERGFGLEWFRQQDAGAFLREVASGGRRENLASVLNRFCGEAPRLPDFS
jgi:hypothetical protein